jgi:methyl-accepting chemotaxis protein
MVEDRNDSFWKRVAGAGVGMDLGLLLGLGLLAYLLFRHAASFKPMEGAILMMAAASLLRLGRGWWEWQRGLMEGGVLGDWVRRILQGERAPMRIPAGMRKGDLRTSAALNSVLGDALQTREELTRLRQAVSREWRELDALFEAIERSHASEQEGRQQGATRLEALGRDLRVAMEEGAGLDQIELNHRLRADQHRLQGQTFRAALGQVHGGLEQFENLLEELQDTFPRLRREEDALGRLADAGLRQGARLSLAVKGLVAHTPRLVEETQARQEWLHRFRQSADGVRDQTQALARRIEAFREESQIRIRTFSGAQGSMKGLDHVAQQTGLLAVNAAILAQQGGGSAGMAAIGGRLRSLADQTAAGASELERALDHHQQGLERETAGLWDLQEVTERLLSGTHELLRMAGHLDQQSHDLERALEIHLSLVDQVRQSSERAELSLREVGERASALESAHGRQWGVEAKIAPERERLFRAGGRLSEVGEELARISQMNIEEIWGILSRHQEVRISEAYRQITSEGFARLVAPPEDAAPVWNRIPWARAERRARFAEASGAPLPMGRKDAHGDLWMLLLGRDALGRAEPSALESWSCDATGQVWQLLLHEQLRNEDHRLALMETLKESPLLACFPGLSLRIAAEGVELRLSSPYPRLPDFLAGLGLALPVDASSWERSIRAAEGAVLPSQRLLWAGPSLGGLESPCLRLVHQWVQDDPEHENFLPWLPYEGQRPPCPMRDEQTVPMQPEVPVVFRCLGLGADASPLEPLRSRLLAAGAIEGGDGLVLCTVGMGHAHPEALLLRLFQSDAGLAGSFHPDLVPYQARLRDEVLNGNRGDSYRAAWSILEDLQKEGWVVPL